MVEKRRFLGEYLVDKKIINRNQLDQAVKEAQVNNQPIGEVLVSLGFAKEEDIIEALSEQLGIAYIDIDSYQIDVDSVYLIPKEAALELRAIPVYRVADSLTVALDDPLNVYAIDMLERMTKMSIRPVFATGSSIQRAIEKYYGQTQQAETTFSAEQMGGPPVTPSEPSQKGQVDSSVMIREATQEPVVKIVKRVLEDALKKGASDIHLEPQPEGFYCRYRVDGILQDFIPLPVDMQLAIVSRFKIMASMDIAEKRLPQDGSVQLTIMGRSIDLRLTTFPTICGEHLAIRVLDKSSGILSLGQLGLEGEMLTGFERIIRAPHGLILVTGPTGSGKSTTLYAVLNTIRSSKKNIITLEDPVEYNIPHIHQSQVNTKAGLTFAVGLRSIVRLDPDIIMIGEIRDKETAEIAIHAALTGHLVFSTLHTNSAASSCMRLIDLGVEPYLLASSLRGIMAQRLVRKLCEKCKQAYEPSAEELDKLKIDPQERGGLAFYKEAGCAECFQTGYKGRTGIYEMMPVDDEIRKLIAQSLPAHAIQELLKQKGIKMLLSEGAREVKAGVTSVAEVLRVISEE